MALLIALALAIPAIAAEWCARPVGAGTREAVWKHLEPLLPELRRIAGGNHFAVITMPRYKDLVAGPALEAYRRGARESYVDQFLELRAARQDTYIRNPKLKIITDPPASGVEPEVDAAFRRNDGKYSREFIRVAFAAVQERAEQDAQELVVKAGQTPDAKYTEDDAGKPVDITYFYSSSPHFQERVGIGGAERGATLLTSGGELDRVYHDPHGTAYLLRGVPFVFIDDLPVGTSVPLEGPDRAIIRLPAMSNPDYRDLVDLLHGGSKTKLEAFSLLPTTAADVAPWGLDDHLARSYAQAGAKIAKAVKKSGLRSATWSAAGLKAQIETAVDEGRRPILIGEAAPGGKVRLSGTDAIFDPQALSEAARRATFFMFCNSSESAAAQAGFSIEGRIFLDTAAKILGTLGREDGGQQNSRSHVDGASAWARDLIEAIKSASGADASDTIPVYRFRGRASPTAAPTTTTAADGGDRVPPTPGTNPGLLLFLYGAFGGACSEFFRWRALLSRPRARHYRKPSYVILSALFVAFAGGVGFVLGRLASTDLLQTVSAFAAGVGLEEVVKRLSRLKAPNVPFGATRTEGGVHEFLSG